MHIGTLFVHRRAISGTPFLEKLLDRGVQSAPRDCSRGDSQQNSFCRKWGERGARQKRTSAAGTRTLVRRPVGSTGGAGTFKQVSGSTARPPFSEAAAQWSDASATPVPQDIRSFQRTEVRAPIEWVRLNERVGGFSVCRGVFPS